MPLKRFSVCTTVLASGLSLLALGLTTAAQAQVVHKFPLTGGGGQLHIGNGLALPIQQAAVNSVTTGTMFPPLLIPVKVAGQTVMGTLEKPLITVGTKMGYQRQLTVPAGVLNKPGVKKTVGVKFSNPTVFAVATNLTYDWPAAPAVFSTGVAPPASVTGFGGTMVYSNTLGMRFGGPAAFAISNSDPVAGDLYPAAPVTVFIKINATTPPCTFMTLGMGPGCVNGVILALPTGLAGPGNATTPTVASPGFVIPGANVAAVKMGMTPLGTHVMAPPAGASLITLHATAGTMTAMVPAPFLVAMAGLPTNMAMSKPGPWTTGQVIIANPAAVPATETWTLSGRDDRTALGGGSIQMVSGAVSARPASGANANRGWVRLDLLPVGFKVPSMSPMGFAAAAVLMMLAFGYATRRRLFA